MAPSEGGHPGIKDDAVNDANVVLPANGCRRVVEMSLQIIDADAESEGRREAVFNAAANSPGWIVNVTCIQATISVWKGSGDTCSTGEEMNIRAQRVAIRGIKHGTNQVAEHAYGMSRAVDVRGALITKVQFCSKALAGIYGNANVHSTQNGPP